MHPLLRTSTMLDTVIDRVAMVFVWSSILLMLAVIYDVITRYFGLPRGFGLNATKLQESEYWFHTLLFTFTLAWAYRRQAHVRIDLIRDRLPLKVKFLIEIIGCLLFLIPLRGHYLLFHPGLCRTFLCTAGSVEVRCRAAPYLDYQINHSADVPVAGNRRCLTTSQIRCRVYRRSAR